MFGLSSSTLLKQEIICILYEQKDYVSSEKIVELLGYSNSQMVKKKCQELIEIIYNYHLDDEIKLITTRNKGIKLTCSTNNDLQKITEYIFLEDLAYNIYSDILFERLIVTTSFCKKNFISESTLQRKVKHLNNFLHKYKLHISFSSVLKINGSEVAIRNFTFLFHFFIHRRFSSIPRLSPEQKKTCYERTKDIEEVLHFDLNSAQREILAVLLFVNSNAAAKNKHILFTEQQNQMIHLLSVTNKPSFLMDWTQRDWIFFLVSIYCYDFNNIHLELHPNYDVLSLFLKEADLWMTLFQYSFVPLSDHSKQFIKEELFKQYIIQNLFYIDENLIKKLFNINLEEVARNQPFYMQKFFEFWTFFKMNTLFFDTYQFKISSLLLCTYVLPFKDFLPTISIYFYSDLPQLNHNYLLNNVIFNFSNQYIIEYVSDIQYADLVISTTSYLESHLLAEQDFVVIRPDLPKIDLKKLEGMFKKIVKKRG
ncbi:helix-turn-helix domain-containing protein [Enterococcus avium]|uniref:helix-turn-helix domain-containing protein n=1 Tax=Enterococcus avium TaxID=33945 RepID=UPI00232C584A|nr:helix-turn-helix domain-containing protein [Enterococcus avium]MDB1730386.1 helix-turn-helix domain-containing protein [Enterococcus avium]MDB1734679.1 helix-turn-helix domain-containing protein [Enterococcus avium]